MNKELIRSAILMKLEDQLQLAKKAANEARELAIHEQSQPETQYDTVGLEASYLAHGQSQRVLDLEAMIHTFRKHVFRDFTADEDIGLTALVRVQYPNTLRTFFIAPCAGGLECDVEGEHIQLLTPQAPLAKALIGAYEGDEVNVPGQAEWLEIHSVI